jgi:DNA-binding beta-propeller fold protein YncE
MMKSIFIVFFGLILASGSFAVTGDVEKSFPAPYSCPTGMAAGGGFLYLADCKSDLIYMIDPQTGKVESEIRPVTDRRDWPMTVSICGWWMWSTS